VIAAPPISPAVPVLDVDAFDPAVIENHYPFHDQLREAGPVVWLSAYGTYGTGRFAEVQAVFRDWEHFTSAAGAGLADNGKPGAGRPGGPIVEMDPPVHTRAREALNDIISPKIVRGWQETSRAYRDLTERDGLRPAINADPAWQRYVADVTPLIADMRSMLLASMAMGRQESAR
jgi:4-methoxybenzoate monooxygenase (O-demethylating)